MTVERAFGILKSRWGVPQKRLDSSLAFAIKTALACIVLHNICVDSNDDWDDADDDRHDRLPPAPITNKMPIYWAMEMQYVIYLKIL